MTKLDSAFFTKPISHRTLHDITDGRPENSFEGAQAAIDAGYAIEIDLQLSSDGVAVVFHDYELARLTGQKGYVQNKTAAKLVQIKLLHGERTIPSFEEFLKFIDGRVPLLVELKAQNLMLGEESDDMVNAVKRCIEEYSGPLAFMSFNPHMIATFARVLPDYPRGIVTDPYTEKDWPMIADDRRKSLAKIPDYENVGASFISHNVNDLQSDAVAKIKGQGGAVFCWTVRSKAQEAEARKVAQNVTFEKYLAQF
ncbi:phosphodiesterase [Amylibacter ulvae]|uniref:Phosphodiesterase n=1 Tax=Paramylibacter ulvae TaxID=1651968 RepID=A0ABQ3D559_9RHOB|nr:glycerophosphodiester phosphodiesterase family protein [Amylibacter ulvae]GHA59392.1 phosphodiesterase [Amylibacter ulvae]